LKIICERAWILLRPSGTEDVVRLYVEAKGEDILQKFKESAVNVFGLDVK
jgi:phosphomannomutase